METSNNYGTISLKNLGDGNFEINSSFVLIGRQKASYYLWYIPSIDFWFQTKEESQRHEVAKTFYRHYIDSIIESRGIDGLFKRLKEIGWTGLPSLVKVKRKTKGYRAIEEKIVDIGASNETKVEYTKHFQKVFTDNLNIVTSLISHSSGVAA